MKNKKIEEYKSKLKTFYREKFLVNTEIHENDFIFDFLVSNPCFSNIKEASNYYFEDGLKSANLLRKILFEELFLMDALKNIKLLEFASGYGCVTRHISSIIPGLNLTASDIHLEASQFIKDNFGCSFIQSTTNPDDYPNEIFDIIFALSFFSHMPRSTWTKWLNTLVNRCNPGGYIIFTTHGFESLKYLNCPSLDQDGFFFRSDSEQKDLAITDYGLTATSPLFVIKEIDKINKCKLISLKIGYWWSHQDLYILKRV
ncbi:MAG: class I SAM-dependent methyltransferase [Verrucomicrobia bacterium]|nr:MAG: class I SAM-dependent methyltransferase [Verrucomicrobiota bacterium]